MIPFDSPLTQRRILSRSLAAVNPNARQAHKPPAPPPGSRVPCLRSC